MKYKWLLLSLLLHGIFFSLSFLGTAPKKYMPIELTVTGTSSKANNRPIIPKILGKGDREHKEGYWGIGIYQDLDNHKVIQYKGEWLICRLVSRVIEGYPAESMGIMPGDAIVEVDGHADQADNYIVSATQKLITITVERKGRYYTFRAMREYIYVD